MCSTQFRWPHATLALDGDTTRHQKTVLDAQNAPKTPKKLPQIGSFLLARVLPHNASRRPTCLYCAPLHSTIDHIISAIFRMSSTNTKICKKSCGLLQHSNSCFSLRPVVV